MLFFICCIIGIILFSVLAEKKESRRFLLLAIVLLICVTGLRAESVGIDTTNYYEQFELISNSSGSVAFNEITFVFLCKFLMQFLPEYWMLIFVFSCVICIFTMLRLWDFRDKISFSTAVVLFLIFHLTASMNIMRQYISVAILFYASRYIEKKKTVRFLIGVLLACCFHFTAILGVALIPMMLLCNKTTKDRYIKLILIIAIIVPVALIVFENNIEKYSFFYNNIVSGKIGIGLISKLIVLVLFWYFRVRQTDPEEKDYLDYLCLIDLAYIVLSALGYRFIYMNRVALPFSLFEIVLYSYMIYFPTEFRIEVAQNKFIGEYAVPVFVLCAYVIFQSVVYDGHGVFPYLPIWQ